MLRIEISGDMNLTLGFDVYGRLVDPAAMADHLSEDVGPKAADFAECYRAASDGCGSGACCLSQ